MALVMTDDRHYRDIAAAIRSKLTAQALYTPAQMGDAVRSIPTLTPGSYLIEGVLTRSGESHNAVDGRADIAATLLNPPVTLTAQEQE